MIDPLERWREHGEKPDYAGLLTFAGMPYTQDAGRAGGRRRRDRGRADRRPRLRPAGHPLRPARDPRRELPARPAPGGGDRRLRGAEGRRLRRRAGAARRPAAHARGDRGDSSARSSTPARCRSSSAATTRSPSRTSARCAARRGPIGLIHFDTHTDTGAEVFGVELSHGSIMYRLVEQGHVDPAALRPDRPARLLAGGDRVRLAARARDHEPLHARRARARHPRGGRASALAAVGAGPGVPERGHRRARPGLRARHRARRSRAG